MRAYFDIDISIHAPRVGSDNETANMPPITGISIHAPRVGSDFFSSRYNSSNSSYFNPRSPCGERQKLSDCFLWAIRISIHAPRVGSDNELAATFADGSMISIHAPRVGSDCQPRELLPVAGHFNPRSPCGERPVCNSLLEDNDVFQSTLPVWGATTGTGMRLSIQGRFQSTLPVWGATRRQLVEVSAHGISIHAPRVGSDRLSQQ